MKLRRASATDMQCYAWKYERGVQQLFTVNWLEKREREREWEDRRRKAGFWSPPGA
jgi:hypothetical protein